MSKNVKKLGIAPSMAAAASICDLSIEALKAAKSAGCPSFAGSGRVNCDLLLKWLGKHPEVLEQAGEHVNAHFESAMKTRADRLLREHRLSVLKKDYVAANEVESEIGAMVGAAKAALLCGPPSLAPQVVGVSVQEAEKILRDWVHNVLSRLHKNPLGPVETQTT